MVRTAVALLAVLVGASCGDDSSTSPIEVKADNGVPLCGKAVVYLNFEGVTLHRGGVDDSHLDVVQDPNIPDGLVIKPYTSQADRELLTGLIDARLATQGIPVVHTRPTTGDYFMLVFVDEFLVGIQGGRSTTNCGYANPNTIGFVNTEFFSLHGGLEYALHGAMLMVGRAAGLDPIGRSESAENCMVNDDFLAACTFAAVSNTLGPCALGPQDQPALLDELACK